MTIEAEEIKDPNMAPKTESEASGKDGPKDVELGVESQDVDKNIARMKSVLSSSDDPFAPRAGKTLLWRNVNMVLVSALE